MKKLTTTLLIACFSFSLCACGGDGTECGPGTTDQNGTCVPDIIECGDGTLYTGITTDVERRLGEHDCVQ